MNSVFCPNIRNKLVNRFESELGNQLRNHQKNKCRLSSSTTNRYMSQFTLSSVQDKWKTKKLKHEPNTKKSPQPSGYGIDVCIET